MVENRCIHYYDILKETEDTISYAEHINPKNILLGNKSERLDDIIVNYKNSLILDIWIFLFNKV